MTNTSTPFSASQHFEMPYENRDRMVKFYRDVFTDTEGNRASMLQPEEM